MATTIKTAFGLHCLSSVSREEGQVCASMEVSIRQDDEEDRYYMDALEAHLPDEAENTESFGDRGYLILRYDLALSKESVDAEDFEFDPHKDDFDALNSNAKECVLKAIARIEPLVAETDKAADEAMEKIKDALQL